MTRKIQRRVSERSAKKIRANGPTSMDSDEVFEKDIEEGQKKAEDEWRESLNQSRSSSMMDLVPANFRIVADMQERVQDRLQSQAEVSGMGMRQFSNESLQKALQAATGQSHLITFSPGALRNVQQINLPQPSADDSQFAVPRAMPHWCS